MDYQLTLIVTLNAGVSDIRLKVLIPVTSLCPCSKAISERGAHNQPSHVTVSVKFNAFIWIEEIIAWVESQASAPIDGLLKRAEEKFVTEQT